MGALTKTLLNNPPTQSLWEPWTRRVNKGQIYFRRFLNIKLFATFTLLVQKTPALHQFYGLGAFWFPFCPAGLCSVYKNSRLIRTVLSGVLFGRLLDLKWCWNTHFSLKLLLKWKPSSVGIVYKGINSDADEIRRLFLVLPSNTFILRHGLL